MWKKEESTADTPPQQELQPRRSANPAPPQKRGAEQATIGPSITIKGEVSGDEDLLIQGRVEGSVDLEQHAVEVGREGRVKANITARVITVEGEVEGDLEADEQIVLRPSARVKGDIAAPRVVLEDGANFRGMVEMGEPARSERKASSPPATTSASRPGSPTSGAGSATSTGAGTSSSSASSGSTKAG